MPIPVIAIFDIGKTNKKLFLFDENYNIVFEKSETLPEVKDEDGFPCEDIHELIRWVNTNLDFALQHKEFKVRAINFSAHGASFVHLNEEGEVITPLCNYLKPFPDHLKKKFDQEYDLQEVCVKTASPYLGNLNSGLQLYLLKQEKPKVFEQVKYALHLPEFFCHLLTKEKVSGLPSIGCHTLLWDFKSEDYHSWVKSENILSKLAPTFPSVHTFQITKAKEVIQVGIGLHDSSAALIPYLKKIKEPFALISTGTWSISLNPFNHSELTQDELNKDCLRYLSYDGKPVKASRLLIGPEHDEQVNRMAEHFHVNTNFFKSIAFEKENLPLKEIGHFAKCNLNEFTDSSKAYHAFVRSLVTRQVASTQLILNNSSVKAIYVDGGFSSNPVYMNLLATELRQYKLFGTTISQASALGAALSLHSKWNNTNENDQISIVPY